MAIVHKKIKKNYFPSYPQEQYPFLINEQHSQQLSYHWQLSLSHFPHLTTQLHKGNFTRNQCFMVQICVFLLICLNLRNLDCIPLGNSVLLTENEVIVSRFAPLVRLAVVIHSYNWINFCNFFPGKLTPWGRDMVSSDIQSVFWMKAHFHQWRDLCRKPENLKLGKQQT